MEIAAEVTPRDPFKRFVVLGNGVEAAFITIECYISTAFKKSRRWGSGWKPL
jgi:hypothetical protein